MNEMFVPLIWGRKVGDLVMAV